MLSQRVPNLDTFSLQSCASPQRRAAESARDEALAKVAELERVREQLDDTEQQVFVVCIRINVTSY